MPDQAQGRRRRHRCAELIVQRHAIFDILQHEVQQAVLLAVIVDRQNIMVLQRRDCARFALEPHGELRVAVREQHLDCDMAVERFLVGFIHGGHAAMADGLDQLILPKPGVEEIAHRWFLWTYRKPTLRSNDSLARRAQVRDDSGWFRRPGRRL
ncbi:MAG: hypothetical protein U0Z44_12235 [Kouleothrix sp.]